jgi:polyphosphate kinase
MDEFFTQRNGGLKQQIAAGVTESIPAPRQRSEQWSEAMATAHDLLERQAQPKSA